MGYKLWASANAAPLLVCAAGGEVGDDDRGRKSASELAQIDADWDFGKQFKRVRELVSYMNAKQLERAQKCSRLAIMAHGAPGLVDIESMSSGTFSIITDQQSEDWKNLQQNALSPDTIDKFKDVLRALNAELEPNAYVLFMSCNMGHLNAGSKLLMELSNLISNASIVGFTRVGTSFQVQSLKNCDFPGMKVGDNVVPSGNVDVENKRKQALLNAPFADENNIFAKVAKGGKLTKDPEPEESPLLADHWVNKLIGEWQLEIPPWVGLVGFLGAQEAGAGKAYWASYKGAPQHPGTWKRSGMDVVFGFDDDATGYKRVFTVKITAASNFGVITVAGKYSGKFTLVDIR